MPNEAITKASRAAQRLARARASVLVEGFVLGGAGAQVVEVDERAVRAVVVA